ncbi:bestrophin-2-like [Musca vetustissima]|uniref:bestrophin-2-like n=1 Tax=Musca vetustissima TaxID=27455 RepID=UPI002AB61CF4|nr:bestrophin-2-like [Musca vetustissima]
MTVSYASEVAQCRGFGCFPKLLLRWRASIYKLIWLDLFIYLSIYYALNFTYRFYLNESHKQIFETIVVYCYSSISLIPLMFVLGFYVSVIVKRWWEQYMTLPWPDNTAVYVSSLIRGQDENGRKMRRTIMRYVCLSLTMVLTRISPRVKKRFPTLDYLVDAGLLVENEKQILKSLNEKFAKHPKHWMPIVWASAIVTRARKEGRIRDDSSLKTLIDALNGFREKCMVLTFYDTMSIPLVYTQVVTIAVYTFFLASVFGRQWTGQTDPDGIMNIVDYFFPIFTVLEFMFFMGWLKVAESLICPFGEDDDDFELNWLIDRNLQVSYLIVDEMHNEHPELLKDQYWQRFYQAHSEDPPLHSTAKSNSNIASRSTLGTDKLIIHNEEMEEVEGATETKPSSIECRFSTSSTNDNSDDFENLKAQRTLERLQRQHLMLTIPTSRISETDKIPLISTSNESSQLSTQDDGNAKDKSGETKKNI